MFRKEENKRVVKLTSVDWIAQLLSKVIHQIYTFYFTIVAN